MKVVLDTNVLLVSFSTRSKYRPIFDSFLKEEIILCVSTDILLEYEEVIGRHMGRKLATDVMLLIENALNVEWITNYYKWDLIDADPDDNKFVDCAIACNAKCLVSNDRHFASLKELDFPKVEVVAADQFLELLAD
ncbi:MAG: putative toxin-antitoxin system toxin component, PIN family [Flavobacteriales bacterium]|nr:putative toxin-antitoxin system toxin component, PIN family [Flavobacteriales bacterium]